MACKSGRPQCSPVDSNNPAPVSWHPLEGELCPRCGDHDVYVYQVIDGRVIMKCAQCCHRWHRETGEC